MYNIIAILLQFVKLFEYFFRIIIYNNMHCTFVKKLPYNKVSMEMNLRTYLILTRLYQIAAIISQI